MKLSAVRSALVVDTIVEVLWAVSPTGERDIWTALITNVLKLVVHIALLKKTSDGVLLINDEFAQDSWPIKLICDTCADVVEMADAQKKEPADVPTGGRWWRRPPGAAEASSSTRAGSAQTRSSTSAGWPRSDATSCKRYCAMRRGATRCLEAKTRSSPILWRMILSRRGQIY